MARYRPLGPRDDISVEDGDEVFLGFRSRVQPAALPAGVARYIENGRCDRGTFRPRKGTKALSTDLTLVTPPVVLDFVLPTEKQVSSITRVGTTATATTTIAHGFSTGDVVAIMRVAGANGLLYMGDFTITVTSTTTFTYVMAGTPGASATAEGFFMLCARGLRIFETYDDMVRGSCTYASNNRVEGVVMATTNRAFVYRAGSAITEIEYPTDETVQATDTCDLKQFLDKVYLLRGYQTADVFTLTSLTRSSAVATATKTAHGLSALSWVDIQGAAEAQYNGIFQIATVPTANTFTYAVTGTPTSPATGTITARPCKPPLVWDCNLANAFTVVPTGYHPTGGTIVRMPAADWGVDFTRRLILPYSRTEHILSDFGDANAYDTNFNQLRILPGSVDWLIGVQPFQGLRYIVLYRKSVHQVELDTTAATPVAVSEITRAFGCVARKSVANCGDTILWLSDLGVTGLQIARDLNLIPLTLPISDQINDQIEDINWTYAANAVALYWNNRYYLAVPTGSSTRNNTVLVFNFLNRSEGSPIGEWESVDTFQGDFDVQAFHLLDYQGQKRLHAGTSFGFLFLLEEREEDEWGNSAGSIGSYPIAGKLFLRDFILGTRERKRFIGLRVSTNLTAADTFTIDFVARNPDRRTTVHTYTAPETTDANAAVRVPGVRGAAGTVEVLTTAGRPEIRSIAIEATTADRADNVRT
jgi:hypothetical protein